KRFNEEFFTILTEKKQTLPSGKYATLCANFRRSGSRWLFKIKYTLITRLINTTLIVSVF
ncbi:hypothetical protein MJI95_39055, partial [Salmonella enterica subsp. enterica serovar Kentucky]|nr:hypothetical protein [Salmonella enterica subsp. enterica serovar Kentucky]